ncbi:hypothetical protein MSAN_01731700 [Mycena sanguinolenta]|uniref:GATA-type domain-containing protein n=1 Tax=Mycena sanguinolenta TaxID=230812 RepID=A0A8H6XXI9_9AGAR|nr:hypothetical protein MSAN_01731700 [Mycena sanguinolenta]
MTGKKFAAVYKIGSVFDCRSHLYLNPPHRPIPTALFSSFSMEPGSLAHSVSSPSSDSQNPEIDGGNTARTSSPASDVLVHDGGYGLHYLDPETSVPPLNFDLFSPLVPRNVPMDLVGTNIPGNPSVFRNAPLGDHVPSSGGTGDALLPPGVVRNAIPDNGTLVTPAPADYDVPLFSTSPFAKKARQMARSVKSIDELNILRQELDLRAPALELLVDGGGGHSGTSEWHMLDHQPFNYATTLSGVASMSSMPSTSAAGASLVYHCESEHDDYQLTLRYLKDTNASEPSSSSSVARRCSQCQATNTIQWRTDAKRSRKPGQSPTSICHKCWSKMYYAERQAEKKKNGV